MEGESKTSSSDHKRRQTDRKDRICQKFSLINPAFEFLPGETLFFFDEIQIVLIVRQALRRSKQMDVLISELEWKIFSDIFKEYMVIGGMPAIVNSFVRNGNYSGILKMQRQILLGYEEDITKYANSLDKTKILNVYRKIPGFLGKSNKKFQISKVEHGARNREYVGVVDWLSNAGMINVCYCMDLPELPLKRNYDPDNYQRNSGDGFFCLG